jgi:pimeloyl-ACP methyl ester carboxylesterase
MTSHRDMYWQSHDRLRLYARVYDTPAPARATVLCLPGLRRNSSDFEDIAPHLQQAGYRLIAPDFRGRGLSARDRRVTNYQTNVYVHDLLKLLSVLEVQTVSVLGTALGGLVGMMLAVAQRARVSGLILNDMGPEVAATGAARFLSIIADRTPPRDWAEATRRQQALYADAWPDLPPARWSQLTRRVFREDAHGRITMDCDPMVTDMTLQRPASSTDLWPLWAGLHPLPVQVIHGARSDVLTPPILERMAKEHPGLRHVSLADRGHFPLLDEPVAIHAIDHFLLSTA